MLHISGVGFHGLMLKSPLIINEKLDIILCSGSSNSSGSVCSSG